MLLALDPSEALALIGPHRILRDELIIPERFPVCPNSPYQQGYDWLYRYEREIAAFLDPWLKPFRYELIGDKGLLCEALSNAFYHGHQRNVSQPIAVRVVVGQHGLLVRIKDNGAGFEMADVFKSYLTNQRYYALAGNGIRLMAQNQRFGIFYADSGTAFHLLYLFAPFQGRLSNFAITQRA